MNLPNKLSIKSIPALRRLQNDGNFRFLLKASTFNAVTKIVGTILGFVATFMIAKTYGPALLGKVATITSTFTLLALFALFGNQTLIVKVIPEHIEKYGYTNARYVYNKFLFITLSFAAAIIAIWNLAEVTTPFTLLRGMEDQALFITILIALYTYRRLNTKALRALGDYKIYSYIEMIPPLLLALVTIVSVTLSVSERIFQYIYFLPQIILFILSFYFVRRTFLAKTKQDSLHDAAAPLPTSRSLIQSSLPMFGVTISTAIITHFDILMLNYFKSSSTVGVYAVYAKIVVITALATKSISSMFGPTVSKLYSTNKNQELKTFAKKTTLLSFGSSLALCLTFLLIHKPFLSFYGEYFTQDLPTLYILLSGSVIGSFFGPIGLFLNMTGHQTAFFRIILFGAVINIVLNMLLIPLWGALGAALATLACFLTWNILATLKMYKEFGYTIIWSRGLFK